MILSNRLHFTILGAQKKNLLTTYTMKKLLLFGLIATGFMTKAQTTITAANLQWTANNQFPGKIYNETGVGLDLTAGTGKTLDITTYTTGAIDTIFALPATSGDVKIKSTLLGELDYKNTGTDWAVSGAEITGLGFVPTNDNNGTIGLPHVQGGTSASSTSAGTAPFLFTINVAIDVVSSGTVKTAWGTFDCVLVKENLSGAYTREAYYIETELYGRVAAFVPSQSKIWTMESPIQVSTTAVESSNELNVFPNPATNALTIKSEAVNAQVKIFNALGNEVKSIAFVGVQQQINVSDLSAGIYVVQVSSATGIETKSVVIK